MIRNKADRKKSVNAGKPLIRFALKAKSRYARRGVTATFNIDGLNRVVKKDYSATTPSTPGALRSLLL